MTALNDKIKAPPLRHTCQAATVTRRRMDHNFQEVVCGTAAFTVATVKAKRRNRAVQSKSGSSSSGLFQFPGEIKIDGNVLVSASTLEKRAAVSLCRPAAGQVHNVNDHPQWFGAKRRNKTWTRAEACDLSVNPVLQYDSRRGGPVLCMRRTTKTSRLHSSRGCSVPSCSGSSWCRDRCPGLSGT